MKKFAVTIEEAAAQLQSEKENRFTVVLKDGDMSVEYFAPSKIDIQLPHKKDELYVIISGTSEFYRDNETIRCGRGDVLFVPAGMEHRFLNFSDDFATWVIFYGNEKNL